MTAPVARDIIEAARGRRLNYNPFNSIDPRSLGAALDGVKDDTDAFLAAAADGGNVFMPDGTAKISGPVVFSNGQTLWGNGRGRAKIVPTGNFDVLTWSGSNGGGARDIRIDAVGMTGGNIINNTNSNRTSFSRLIITDPYNGFYVTKTNNCSIDRVWMNAVTGGYGVQWYGDNSNRSDVLDMDNVIISGAGSPSATSPIAFIMDGNVDTADLRHCGFTNCLRGVHTRNTSGGSAPLFLTAYDLQVDFPYAEAARLEGSLDTVFLTDFYAHGSATADGVYIDLNTRRGSIQGGKIDGHFLRGIFCDGRYIHIGNVNVTTNSQAGNGLWPGVEIGANSRGVSLVGNLLGQTVGASANPQSYGFITSVGARDYTAVGNNCRFNFTGDYQDNAADQNSCIVGNASTTTSVSRFAGPVQAPWMIASSATPTVAAGQVGFGTSTSATVGAAGAAAALPANPLGYLTVNIAGADVKVPYYLP